MASATTCFFFGFFVGFFVATFFFKDNPSIPMLFLTTLLIVPSLIKLLTIEGSIERKDGLHHFFRNHIDVIEVYLFLFLGVFLGYFLLGMIWF